MTDVSNNLQRMRGIAENARAASADAATPVAWMKEHKFHPPTFTTNREAVDYWEKIGEPLIPLYAAPQASQPEIKASEFVLGFWIEDGRIEFASDKDFSSLKDGMYHVCTAPVIAAQTIQPVGQPKCKSCGGSNVIESTDGGKFDCYECRNEGECKSCNNGKCTAGVECVTASNSQPVSGAVTDEQIDIQAVRSCEHIGGGLHNNTSFREVRDFARHLVRALSSTPAQQTEASVKVPSGYVRYCAHCGSIGEVEAKYRDCCPDGNKATYVREEVAEQAKMGFKQMLSDALAAPAPVQTEAQQSAAKETDADKLKRLREEFDAKERSKSPLQRAIESAIAKEKAK